MSLNQLSTATVYLLLDSMDVQFDHQMLLSWTVKIDFIFNSSEKKCLPLKAARLENAIFDA